MNSWPQNSSLMFNSTLCVLAAAILWGCENSFDPLKENNRYNYSMYSILDLSSDTQWVRVMRPRDTINKDSLAPNDATVSLIRESDGRTVELHDSLTALSEGTFVWNFWTTEQLISNETYTVQAESPAGDITYGTAHIPPDYPTPEVQTAEGSYEYSIRIDDPIERIVVAEVTYAFRAIYIPGDTSSFQEHSISHVNDLEEAGNGYQLSTNDIPYIANEHSIPENRIINISAEFLIVSADSNWIGLDIYGSDLPGESSNIENGLGLVTGIVSKRVHLSGCNDPNNEVVACTSSNYLKNRKENP